MTHDRLAALADRFWAFQRHEFPISAIQAGEPIDEDVLMREAPADHERRAVWAASALAELGAIDPATLDTGNRATHALLHRELTMLVETVATRAHLRPSLYPLGPEFMPIYWANATSLATAEDTARYLRRIATIPAGLDGVRAALAEGVAAGLRYPRLVVERAAEHIGGHVAVPVEESPFYGPLARVAGRFPALAAEGRTLIAERIHPAYEAYAEFVESTLGPVARDSLACTDDHDGDAFYRHQIRFNTTLEADPEEIHALGLAEVERITAEMLAVAAEAGFPGDLAGFRRRLKTDNWQFAESAEALREQIEVLSKRIDGRIPEFFGRVPRATYGVRSMPEAVAVRMPPAYAQPNPADNSAAGVHWITSIPGKCPRYMHVPLALHEAWPGHLMHLALLQEQDLPAFRRHGALRYSACLEGWAMYSERLGEDMGLYDTPEKRYGRLEMEIWRAVRLVVDTGLHARGWSREAALDYFGQHVALPAETIAAEVDRYIAMPAQALAYQLGNRTFRDIRAQAEAALGDGFRIRAFHDALMAAGPVTLPLLRTLMEDWTARQAA